MARRIQNKWFLILVFFGLGLCLPLLIGAIGDLSVYGDLIFMTEDKAIKLKASAEDAHYCEIYGTTYGDETTLKIPDLAWGDSTFMTVDSEGKVIFLSTTAYDGDIQSVWTDESGDVSAMTASLGDSFNAASADSTIPWKVAANPTPTTEGLAIWDSNSDSLRVGDGTNTTSVGPPGHPPISASSSGYIGKMAYDSKYVYCYVQSNVWKRAALSTWTESCWLWPDGSKILWPDGDFILLTE